MQVHTAENNIRPNIDIELSLIADYVTRYEIKSELAYTTARYCLMDAMGCAMLALRYPECARLLGPIIQGIAVTNGARVPGTDYILDPVQAAFNIGTMIRWLDFNDTWLAAEWGHPSDNLGAILAVADYQSRKRISEGKPPLCMRDVLTAMIKAYEIQGILALENSFNRVGIDHVILVKVASTALATYLLGGQRTEIINALSQAWIDGGTLRAYRHAPNTGTRKSWAAGDATSRAVWHALMALRGEMGYASPLSAKKWGFYDVCLHGKPITFGRSLGSYVMENILLKISFPAEFHAQTAVECALTLHRAVKNRLEQIEKIVITTQESAIRIISKTGPLHNPADRDHCLQYMVAAALIHGDLKADYYSDVFAKDPKIDFLRSKMVVQENPQFSQDYLDPDKRSISNALKIYFNDGSSTEEITVEYPIGHHRRRTHGIPILFQKFSNNLALRFPADKVENIVRLFEDPYRLEDMPVSTWMEIFVDC